MEVTYPGKNGKFERLRDGVCLGGLLFAVLAIRGIGSWWNGNFTLANEDNFQVVFPFFSYFMDSLRERGSLDPWNPYVWGGMPAIGNPNVPFNIILYALFHLPKADFVRAMNLHVALEMFSAACGFYVLLRLLYSRRLVALSGALFFLFGSSTTILTSFYSTFFHFVIIPWVLIILLTASQRGFLKNFLLLVPLFYLQFTYGQIQMTVYSAWFLALCVVWLLREHLAFFNSLKLLFSSSVMGALLAAHHLLPLIDFLRTYSSREAPSWMAFSRMHRVPVEYLSNLFAPQLFWGEMDWWPLRMDGWSLWESFMVYGGILCFALFSFALLRSFSESGRRSVRPWFFFSVFLIGLCTTQPGGVFATVLAGGKTVPFGRWAPFLCFPLIFLSAFSLKHVLYEKKEARIFAIYSFLLGVVLYAFSSEGFLSAFVQLLFQRANTTGLVLFSSAQIDSFWFLHRETLNSILIQQASLLWIFSLLFLLASLFPARAFGALVVLALTLGWVEPFLFQQRVVQKDTDVYPYSTQLKPQHPMIGELQKRTKDSPYLVNSLLGVRETQSGLTPNQPSLFRIPSINGYTSVEPRQNAFEPHFQRWNFGAHLYTPTLLKLLSIRWLVSPEERTDLSVYGDRIEERFRAEGLVLYEYRDAVPRYFVARSVEALPDDEALGRKLQEASFDPRSRSYVVGEAATSACDFPVQWEGNEAGAIQLSNPCEQPVLFVSTQPAHPWWRFELDGEPREAVPVNGLHQGMWVPPGVHSLELQLLPQSWRWGIRVSLFSTLLYLALLCWLLFGARVSVSFPQLKTLQPDAA